MDTDYTDIYSGLREIVFCARTGSYSDAASKLNSCLQKLQSILTAGTISPQSLKKLTYSLETLFLMQKQNDWVAAADVIEFEFVDLLRKALDEKNK